MTGFTLPTSRPITQAWGAEFDDWNGDGIVDYPGGFYHSIGWDGHNGIDYGCFTGDPIEAVADGVVTFAGDAGYWHTILSGGGNAVLIEHPKYGVQTEYLHLSQWLVTAGQSVKKGQVIARSGATGAATAPHLHLGMLKINGYDLNSRWRGRIDPTPYLYGNLNSDYANGAAIVPQGSTTKDLMEEIMGYFKDKAEFSAWMQSQVLYAFKNNPELAKSVAKAVVEQPFQRFTVKDGLAVPEGKVTTNIARELGNNNQQVGRILGAVNSAAAKLGVDPAVLADAIAAELVKGSDVSVTATVTAKGSV